MLIFIIIIFNYVYCHHHNQHHDQQSIISNIRTIIIGIMLLLSTPLHQRAASRVQHPKSCGSQQSLPPGGKERLHFVGIRPEVQARKGGW